MPPKAPKASKRERPAEEARFRILFEQNAAFKQLCDIVGSVLGRVSFRICDEGDDALSLCVDTIDPYHVCVVQSKITCRGAVAKEEGEVAFCVETKTLNTCLRNVAPHCTLELSAEQGSSKVVLRAVDPVCDAEVMQFDLDTYDQEIEKLPLDKIVFNFATYLDIPELKRIVKLGNDLNVENVELSVRRKRSACTMRISGKGDAAFHRELVTTLCEDDEANCKDTDLDYASSFKLSYLAKFIKCMDHQQLTMRLGQRQPMLIHYPLGVADSFVRFVLAPKGEEDDDE